MVVQNKDLGVFDYASRASTPASKLQIFVNHCTSRTLPLKCLHFTPSDLYPLPSFLTSDLSPMATKKKPKTPKSIQTLTHGEEKRRNIPTAEFQAMVERGEADPLTVAYERRNRDLDPQLIWRGKDIRDWSALVVPAPPLYIQEKVHPKVLIDDLKKWMVAGGLSSTNHQPQTTNHPKQIELDLFGDFNGVPEGADKTDFYAHDQNWSNRMILGDSLQVMASLAEREGLRGKVQCIYFDPPYGIKFNSNFQWSTTSRDVKDGKADHITREPEQVKAFRDTWRDGIHSYLTYLRDRLTVARDLLTDSGSIFVQIGDENVHRVRAVMDEVFGEDNFCSLIQVQKTSGAGSPSIGTDVLAGVMDYVVWFSKTKSKIKYRQIYREKILGEEGTTQYVNIRNRTLFEDGRLQTSDEFDRSDVFASDNLTSPTGVESTQFGVDIENKIFTPKKGGWKTNFVGMERLRKSLRLKPIGNTLMYRRYLYDFSVSPINNLWRDVLFTGFAESKVYVVQTAQRLIERCILMATDPGDLVLDPTCGSGTTAYVAEQWGRRWITVDTSRVALALARARIMGARYPYYLLADSREGQKKEADIARSIPSSQPVKNDIRQGFVYERVPHITLKSIANNSEIDVIWERFEQELAPLREKLSVACGLEKTLEEWEFPRELPEDWVNHNPPATTHKSQPTSHNPPATNHQPLPTSHLLKSFWDLRIARQREIDASIAAKADFEFLYDKPYEDKKTVRVAGPFTVESLSPHRVLGLDENDELIDNVAETGKAYGKDYVGTILDTLRSAGVQQAHKQDKIDFFSLQEWPGGYVCAEGRYTEGNKENGKTKRAAIFIGPEFGTVTRVDLVTAAREAAEGGFDLLISCAFSYEAHTTDFNNLGGLPVLKATMNADLHMAGDLKNTGKGNLFVIFGEPDVEVVCGLWLVARDGRMIAHYDSVKELSGLGSLEEINRMGGGDLPGFKKLSQRGAIRADQSDPQGGGVGALQHRGRGGQDGDGGVPADAERGQRLTGGGGDPTAAGPQAGNAEPGGSDEPDRSFRHTEQNAWRTQALAGIETLRKSDFPLTLTTSHHAQVTVHGVDVFHPNTGEIRSDGPEGIACWFLDTDYNEESFFVRHAYFLGQNDPYKALKTTLKAEINEEAWATLNSPVSRPFPKPQNHRIAIKIINHLGDEVMKVFKV